jgi:exodeoxyribonuclease VII large subunit
VARGGGSRESLWAFNTEVVARAIAASPVPTISAVGHETDYTVADHVADVRAATPTAGAEYASPDGTELLNRLASLPVALRARLERSVADSEDALAERADSLSRRMLRRHSRLTERLAAAERTVHARAPREFQRRMGERLANLEGGLRRAMAERLAAEGEQLEALGRDIHRSATARLERLELELARRAAETEARSPLRALARGYAVVTSPEGHVIRDPDEAPAGSPLRVRLAGGNLRARSEGPEPDNPEDDA